MTPKMNLEVQGIRERDRVEGITNKARVVKVRTTINASNIGKKMIKVDKKLLKSLSLWMLFFIVCLNCNLLFRKNCDDFITFLSHQLWFFSIAFPISLIFATAFTYRGRMSGFKEIIFFFRQNIAVFLTLTILLLLFIGFVVPHYNHIFVERIIIASGGSYSDNYKSDREKSIIELYTAQGNMLINPKIKRQYLYELSKKIAIAFSVFTNAFAGLSLAALFKKKSVVNSIVLFFSCVVLQNIYLLLFVRLEDMEYFNPFVIMMIPLIVNLFIGSGLIALASVIKKITLLINKNAL